jgi:hypothetical protein
VASVQGICDEEEVALRFPRASIAGGSDLPVGDTDYASTVVGGDGGCAISRSIICDNHFVRFAYGLCRSVQSTQRRREQAFFIFRRMVGARHSSQE